MEKIVFCGVEVLWWGSLEIKSGHYLSTFGLLSCKHISVVLFFIVYYINIEINLLNFTIERNKYSTKTT